MYLRLHWSSGGSVLYLHLPWTSAVHFTARGLLHRRHFRASPFPSGARAILTPSWSLINKRRDAIRCLPLLQRDSPIIFSKIWIFNWKFWSRSSAGDWHLTLSIIPSHRLKPYRQTFTLPSPPPPLPSTASSPTPPPHPRDLPVDFGAAKLAPTNEAKRLGRIPWDVISNTSKHAWIPLKCNNVTEPPRDTGPNPRHSSVR